MKRRITRENINKLIKKLDKSYDRFCSKFFVMYDECIPKEKVSNKQSKMPKKTLANERAY